MATVEIENFGPIERLKLDLPKVAVLVGANACGKSSVLHAVHGVLGAVHPLGKAAQRLAAGVAERRREGPGETVVRFTSAVGARTEVRWTQPNAPAWSGALQRRPGATMFAPTRDGLLKVVPLRTEVRIEPSGAGIADALAALSDEGRDAVLRLVQRAHPRLSKFQLRRVQVKETVVSVDRDTGDESNVTRDVGAGFALELVEGSLVLPADRASDGTLWALGLGALLQTGLTSAEPHVLLVDDLDRDLHPRAQVEVARALRTIIQARPELSLIATAHSPFLLNAFAPEEVFVLHRAEAGGVRARSLADHPEWPKWKDQLEAGEFWSWAAEAWVDDAA